MHILKTVCSIVIGLSLMASGYSQADDSDDLLLSIVPVIAAAAKPASAPAPLSPTQLLQKLSGDWYFDVRFTGSVDTNEFRFYGNTISQLNQSTYVMDGDQFLGDFGFVYVDAVSGGYDIPDKIYIVVSLWGPPEYDSGSAYVFKTTDKNTANLDCHYFTDGQGNVDSYYADAGGTLPCEMLTKRRRTSAKRKQSGTGINPSLDKAALNELREANKRAALRAGTRKSAPGAVRYPGLQARIKAMMGRVPR